MSRTIPSFAEEGLKRFLHGMDRRIMDLERGGDWRFDTDIAPESSSGAFGGSPQLLCMAASADSAASGGDYVTFTSIIGQHGFSTTISASNTWTHPAAGVYVVTYEHAWASYTAGGLIEVEVNGVVLPEGVLADSTVGEAGSGVVAYYASAGSLGRVKVTQSSGSPLTFDGLVRVALSDSSATGDSALVETLWLDTLNNTSATSTETLAVGQEYRIEVQGNADLGSGSVNSTGSKDAVMFPSGSASNNANVDAETQYAANAADSTVPPVHRSSFTIDLGSGAAHLEPSGGPFSSPTTGHAYTYAVTGEGSTVTFDMSDSPTSDNNGQFRIDIYSGVA